MSDLPNEIYLVPKNKKMVWSEIPSPYPGAKEEDAVKYYHSSVVDELKAQVEQLRKLGLVVVRQCSKSDRYSPEVENLDDALAATPNQCLTEIKAQAFKTGFWRGFEVARMNPDCNDIQKHYSLANQLRQGEQTK